MALSAARITLLLALVLPQAFAGSFRVPISKFLQKKGQDPVCPAPTFITEGKFCKCTLGDKECAKLTEKLMSPEDAEKYAKAVFSAMKEGGHAAVMAMPHPLDK